MFSKKDLQRLILPLVIEQLLAMTVGLMDTVMVSAVGEAAVSGVSLVDMINQLMINIFAALATGGAVVAAQYIGHKENDRACESANQLMVAAGILSLGIGAVCLAANGGLLRLFFGSIEREVMENAMIYFGLSALSYPFLAVYNGGAALFRAMGNSQISLKISFFMNLINVSGNALFIFGLNLGAAGAALGSLLARAVAAAVICLMLRDKKLPVHFVSFRKNRIDMDMTKRILRIGIPNGLENGMFQLGRILVVSIISGFGTTQIAANAVANNLDGMSVIPGQALGLAMVTVIGQCVGAGDYSQAEAYAKKLMKISYLAFFVVDGLILLTLPVVLQMYRLPEDTLHLAWLLVTIHCGCAIFLWTPSFVLPNALRAAGDVKYTMYLSVLSMWLFRILFSFILGKWLGLGAVGVWIAMVMDWLFRDGAFLLRFYHRKWQQKRVI